jgi:hypothetical protein
VPKKKKKETKKKEKPKIRKLRRPSKLKAVGLFWMADRQRNKRGESWLRQYKKVEWRPQAGGHR